MEKIDLICGTLLIPEYKLNFIPLTDSEIREIKFYEIKQKCLELFYAGMLHLYFGALIGIGLLSILYVSGSI